MSIPRTKSRSSSLALCAVFVLGGTLGNGNAAPSIPGFVALPAAEVTTFKADPKDLLKKHQSAGLPLSTAVRNLALTDSSSVAVVISLAGEPDTNSAQRAAIGAGLAEAASLVAASDPKLAASIQAQVAGSNIPDLLTAYLAVAASTATGATSGGAGGGGGGAGGGGSGPVGGVTSNSGSNGGSGLGASVPSTQNFPSSFSAASGVAPPSGGATTARTTTTSPAAL